MGDHGRHRLEAPPWRGPSVGTVALLLALAILVVLAITQGSGPVPGCADPGLSVTAPGQLDQPGQPGEDDRP